MHEWIVAAEGGTLVLLGAGASAPSLPVSRELTGFVIESMNERLHHQQGYLKRAWELAREQLRGTSNIEEFYSSLADVEQRDDDTTRYWVKKWAPLPEVLATDGDGVSGKQAFGFLAHMVRLPSAIPIPVIAALLADEAEDGDRRATVDKVIRQYVWRSFFTNRYEATAATRAYADFRGLTALLAGEGSVADVPVFDDELYPLPSLRELKGAGWAKSKRSLARAILAASNFFGARDFADDTPLSGENVVKREYHHIFPNQLLSEAGIESMLALNCALITWKTNRSIGRLDPLTYLEKRAKNAPDPRDIKDRLESHLVPYEIIANSGPYEQPAGAELRAAVQPDFDAFLDQRAALVDAFMREVCDGKQPHLRDILESSADVR